MGDIIIKMGIFVIAFIIGLTMSSALDFFGDKPWSPVTTPGDTISLDIPLGETGGTEILEVPHSSFPMISYNPIGSPFSDEYQTLPGGIKYDLDGFHYFPAENEYLSSATSIEQLTGGGPYLAVAINGQPVTYTEDTSLSVPVSPSYQAIPNPTYVAVIPSYQVENPSYQVENPSYQAIPNPTYVAVIPSYQVENPSYQVANPSYQVANPSYQVANPSYEAVPGSGTSVSWSGTSISGSGTSISGSGTSISGSSSSSVSGSSGISVSR